MEFVNVLLIGHPDQAPALRPRISREDIILREI